MSPSGQHPNRQSERHGASGPGELGEKDRFLGVLLGAAAGESLGAPHEFKRASDVGTQRELIAGGPWALGEPTDDIALMLALLRSVAARRRLDLDEVARNYLDWYQGNPKDIGNLTRSALRNLGNGVPPAQSGAMAWEESDRKAAGNGSVMCCAPVGLLHVRSLDGLAADAAAASRITHFDPRCVGGCVAVATAIALLVRGGEDSQGAMARAASEGGAVAGDVLRAIQRGGAKEPDELTVDGKDQGFVLHALELAFSALAHAGSLEEGLIAVVARGGDTDTNACIAGALLGAKFGKSQVPDRWAAKLRAAPELLSLGEILYQRL